MVSEFCRKREKERRKGKVRVCPFFWRQERKRRRKDEMNMKRDGGRGGWRWKAEVAGIKKGVGGSHRGKKGKKRNRE